MKLNNIVRTILLIAILLAGAKLASALDPPHNVTSDPDINCGQCHYVGTDTPEEDWWDGGYSSLTDTPRNRICLGCHNDTSVYNGKVTDKYKTHSSYIINSVYDYWDWECIDCHNPHYQRHLRIYRSSAFINTGTMTGITADADPTVTLGTALSKDYENYMFIPNSKYYTLTYKIINSTDGKNSFKIRGPVKLAYAPAGSNYAIVYGRYAHETINGKAVKLFRREGANSLADGDGNYDGVCEVCHTQTQHFRGNGSAPDQLHENLSVDASSGIYCIQCHSHTGGFAHGNGSGDGNCGDCHGKHADHGGVGSTQSHATHLESDIHGVRGPKLGDTACDECHDTNNFPRFKNGIVITDDGEFDLEETNVCNPCHSDEGIYNGVTSTGSSIGAKDNWQSGVYVGDAIPAEKERWCAGCHDMGTSVISSIAAPPVIGNETESYTYGTGWGYYKTGHGLGSGVLPATGAPAPALSCDACHDYSTVHIDSDARTYLKASDNYQVGYRLRDVSSGVNNAPMNIPRENALNESDFALCFECHNSALYIDSTSSLSNFRTEGIRNGHSYHLSSGGAWSSRWDSDWDMATDSYISCPACHNVHGSPAPAMIRHGELISTPGTTDKVPSLDFVYLPSESNLMDSSGGRMLPTVSAGMSISNSKVCSTCHSTAGTAYTRTPADVYPPTVASVYGAIGNASVYVRFHEGVYTDIDNSGSLELGDFSLYDTDNNRGIDSVAHTEGEIYAVLMLNSPLDSYQDLGIDNISAYSNTSIYDARDNAMDMSYRYVIEEDAEAPTASGLSPANGADDAYINDLIQFTLSDSKVGVDNSTISIGIEGDLGFSNTYTINDSGVVSISGDRYSYVITVDPVDYFKNGEPITVIVNAADLLGNQMAAPQWQFITEAVSSPQTIVLHPSMLNTTSGFSNVGGDWADILDTDDGDSTYVTACCSGAVLYYIVNTDSPGLSKAEIQGLKVHSYMKSTSNNVDIGYRTGATTIWNGLAYNSGGIYELISSVTFTEDSEGGTLDAADINNLELAVKRYPSINNPIRVTETYAEVTYVPVHPDDPPVFYGMTPASGSTNIGISNNLSFKMKDYGTGIDTSTLSIHIYNGGAFDKTYTELDAGIVTLTADPAPYRYDVSVNPDINFYTNDTYTVDLIAKDLDGNTATLSTWTFSTEATVSQQSITLHPSGVVLNPSTFTVVGGTWADVLDSNDGDTSYVQKCCSASGTTYFSLDMDDLTISPSDIINSVTVLTYAKEYLGEAVIRLGYDTGEGLLYEANQALTTSYALYNSAAFEKKSDNSGSLDQGDINDLKVYVHRNVAGSPGITVTEVYVDVKYSPAPGQ